jgi:hypothetical protein
MKQMRWTENTPAPAHTADLSGRRTRTAAMAVDTLQGNPESGANGENSTVEWHSEEVGGSDFETWIEFTGKQHWRVLAPCHRRYTRDIKTSIRVNNTC